MPRASENTDDTARGVRDESLGGRVEMKDRALRTGEVLKDLEHLRGLRHVLARHAHARTGSGRPEFDAQAFAPFVDRETLGNVRPNELGVVDFAHRKEFFFEKLGRIVDPGRFLEVGAANGEAAVANGR